jgi:hypothetical protein
MSIYKYNVANPRRSSLSNAKIEIEQNRKKKQSKIIQN